MATAQQIRDAADAVVVARAAFDAAQAAFDAANAEVTDLVENDQVILDAAQATFNAAVDAARISTGWSSASGAFGAAADTLQTAIAALSEVSAQYDQQ